MRPRIISMTTPEPKLAALLQNMLGKTPEAQHALVLSKDGLKLCHTHGLVEERADRLAAMAAGFQSLSYSVWKEFGSANGAGVRNLITEFPGGVMILIEAGDGAHLAVVAAETADVGLVGHNMAEIVEQIGSFLTSPVRSAQPGNPQA
jgi:predicted regulator of Ras-like GTPase activity (Roadblock/LC7/MglB family)